MNGDMTPIFRTTFEITLHCHVREKLIEFIQKNYPDSLPKLRASFQQLPGK